VRIEAAAPASRLKAEAAQNLVQVIEVQIRTLQTIEQEGLSGSGAVREVARGIENVGKLVETFAETLPGDPLALPDDD
jgi:hypothetical protein